MWFKGGGGGGGGRGRGRDVNPTEDEVSLKM